MHNSFGGEKGDGLGMVRMEMAGKRMVGTLAWQRTLQLPASMAEARLALRQRRLLVAFRRPLVALRPRLLRVSPSWMVALPASLLVVKP